MQVEIAAKISVSQRVRHHAAAVVRADRRTRFSGKKRARGRARARAASALAPKAKVPPVTRERPRAT